MLTPNKSKLFTKFGWITNHEKKIIQNYRSAYWIAIQAKVICVKEAYHFA